MVTRLRSARLAASHLGTAILTLAVTGCFDVKSVDPGIEVLPDADGHVASSALGLTGVWYVYGDNYDPPQRCTKIGLHAEDECSRVDWPPPPPPLTFPTDRGRVCTFGSVAQALGCVSADLPSGLACSSPDFSDMWGAGIGLDFALAASSDQKRDPLKRETWDAHAHGIQGVSFDFELIDGAANAPYLRVEFPVQLPSDAVLPDDKGSVSLSTDTNGEPVVAQPAQPFPDNPATPSDEHPSGSPYWGATPKWGNSPVHEGHNELPFNEVKPPPDFAYGFDATKLLGIQFHVPTLETARVDYGFCISNLAFLHELNNPAK
jgi:hypothetical protein